MDVTTKLTQGTNAAVTSVGVTVDLEFTHSAGGHVKCWQRFAEAAVKFPSIDLTVYFLGHKDRVMALSDRVRYRTVVPLRGTRSIGLSRVPGHTDLARRHPGMEKYLANHDVLHATSSFALSGSAQYTSMKMLKRFVASIHTDNPAYALGCTGDIVSGLLRSGRRVARACEWLGLSRMSAYALKKRVLRRLSGAHHFLYSNERQREYFRSHFPSVPTSGLRRGIDPLVFNPGVRNRERFERAFGRPSNRVIVAFAGRLDAAKNVRVLLSAAEELWKSGSVFDLMMIGDGPLRQELSRRCGERGIFPGWVSQEELSWLLASADLLAFPSETETVGNAVLEAIACNVPVAVAEHSSGAESALQYGANGIVVKGRGSRAWARALSYVLAEPAHLSRFRASVRNGMHILPTWSDVLAEDLLPVWLHPRPLASGAGQGLAAGDTLASFRMS